MAIANPNRLADLLRMLTPAKIRRTWKQTVRDGLRHQPVLDLTTTLMYIAISMLSFAEYAKRSVQETTDHGSPMSSPWRKS